MKPHVSVCLTTYNQEAFVTQAIESVLVQNTTFDYELIIGEDDSTDRTREIVLRYKDDPHVRLLLNDRNNVIYIKGRPTGRWNFVNTLRCAQGSYVALLEGDDFWSDPEKLQKQVAFLDAHPDCAISFHNVEYLYEDGHREVKRPPFPPLDSRYSLRHLLHENFIPTCSVIFRNNVRDDFPEWFYRVPMGDWPLHLLNARYGSIAHLDEVMAVYRKHGAGAWSPRSSLYQLEADIVVLEAVRGDLGPEYRQEVDASVARFHLRILQALARQSDVCGLLRRCVALLLCRPVPLRSLIKVARQAALGIRNWSESGKPSSLDRGPGK